jgi:hypothetical protein
MIADYSKLFNRDVLEGILFQYKKKILKEIESVKDLMSLLMKGTKGNWTKTELNEIKAAHFVTLGKKVPVLMVFMLPGGLVLLPVLIEVLDRRTRKTPVQEDRRESPRKRKGSPLSRTNS